MTQSASEPVVLGRIGAPYGTRGWLRVRSYTEPVENILDFAVWELRTPKGWRRAEVVEGRRHQAGIVVRLQGCETPEQARPFVSAEIAVAAARLPELDEGEVYWHDLQGLQVIAREQSGSTVLLGRIHRMMETGANDVMIVQACEGSIDRRERLIPWLKDQVILAVQLDQDRVLVDWDSDY